MTAPSSPTPWTLPQVRVAAACDVVAALAVALAAVRAGDGSLSDDVRWLDLAVLALVLAVVVNGSLLLVARKAIGRRRLRLLPDVLVPIAGPDPASDEAWWWLPGTSRAHRGGCQMIAGKATAEMIPVERIRAEQLVRCEVCG